MWSNAKKYRSKNPLKRILLGRFLRKIILLAAAEAPASILDAGCGEGFVLSELRRSLGARVKLSGFDSSEEAIAVARGNTDAEINKADIYNIPHPDSSFDLVIALEVLEHLERPEAALDELKRVSKGSIMLSVPNEPFFSLGNLLSLKNMKLFGSDPDHKQRWTRSEFTEFVSRRLKIKSSVSSFPWTIILAEKTG
jgi:2-polyprenyl-3-methyl-5-hydroxy-6-metoxy-1,4-benzoquinol methylase